VTEKNKLIQFNAVTVIKRYPKTIKWRSFWVVSDK